jgi:hypothetical protein
MKSSDASLALILKGHKLLFVLQLLSSQVDSIIMDLASKWSHHNLQINATWNKIQVPGRCIDATILKYLGIKKYPVCIPRYVVLDLVQVNLVLY